MSDAPPIDLPRLADELGFAAQQVENVTALLDDGNTVPFITRYRKEQTGNLDEEQIRTIEQRVTSLRQLAERAQTILRLIDAQGKLTPKLRQSILEADSLKRLEDLYLPFRPKRTSRAAQARERGLEPLADAIWDQQPTLSDLEAEAAKYVDAEKELSSPAEVLQGAADILAERIGDDAEIRQRVRKTAWQTGRLVVSATSSGKENGQAYSDYFNYAEAVVKVPPHRVLAINRGEKDKALRVRFEWDDGRVNAQVAMLLGATRHRFAEFLGRCVTDALDRLIKPSLEREIRRELTEKAEEHAVGVFARNLRNLLLTPPLKGQRVLAIDPGFRTGCKLAALDAVGNSLATDVVYVTGSAEKREAARQKLAEFYTEHGCEVIAIGNGTACRETEELVAETIAEHLPQARYAIVNEAGASIYSTSHVARAEFPDLDATARGTISIGRRLQDPLSELVKIEPQHLGVGMYQHDVSSKSLKESLEQVVESCVNYVGVDLNTASASLLRHVSGLNKLIARRVVEWRNQQGQFASRRQLLDVPGIGDATFTQAAGFLRIGDGDEPLDGTWIHPESYDVAHRLLKRMSLSVDDLTKGGVEGSPSSARLKELDLSSLASEFGVGEPTLADIVDALCRPGRDPRGDLSGPVFKQGILKFDDLAEGMELTGTVLNVVDFGAFIDVGLKDSGLVHVSQMSAGWIASPHECVAVGDFVTVWVLGVDRARRRVSLTMISPEQQPAPTPPANQSVAEEPAEAVTPATTEGTAGA